MKILFVCLGNICRSPLGEGIMQNLAEKHHLDILCDSAGTASYHTGEKPDMRSIEIAKEHGIDISKQRSRQFRRSDFEAFDHIFAMDESNHSNIVKHRPKEANAVLHLMRDFDTLAKTNKNVPDPYYGGDRGFADVFDIIERSCKEFLRKEKLLD